MTENELLERTKLFALPVIKLVNALPNNTAGRKIGDQLIRSGTSVADVLKRNLLQNSELSKKKLTKAHFGLN